LEFNMPPTLYLIDGHALAYRTYFALSSTGGQRWHTSSGEPTAGVYGFATVLMRLLENEKPDYIAVAFDTGKTFRDEIFPEYKATRAKMPDDLRPQIERIRQLVDAFNIPRLEMEGFEADDVLGTVAKNESAGGLGVKIITGDRDLLQLVGGGVIVNLPEGKLSDAKDYITDADVIEKLGVPARLVVDYKALVGDKSDNIPGVAGVGEKTTQELFKVYQSLDDIYAHLEMIPPKVRTRLEAGRDAAYMSRDLAQIRTDLPIKVDLAQAKADNFDPANVEKIYRELEFRTLIPKLAIFRKSGNGVPTAKKGAGQMTMFAEAFSAPAPVILAKSSLAVQVVDSEARLKKLSAELKKAEIISFDTETTSTEEMEAQLVGISLAIKAGEGWYIPVGHSIGPNLPVETVVEALRPAMTNPKIPKIGHNAKYDYLMLARNGLKVTPLGFDSMIAEWITDPSSRNLGLKNLVYVRLEEEMTHIEDLIGPKGKNQRSMAEVDVESASSYAAADAETCLRLRPILLDELDKLNGRKLLDEIEMPLVGVLAEMELKGITLDQKFFAKMSGELGKRMAEIEMQVYQLVGRTFNINSTQQLSDVLFKTLKLGPPDRGKKTASGHYSTSADVLEELRGKHEVVDLILENRELTKLKSTYVDTLPEKIDPATGRVHTSYSQTGSVTGRLSSVNPNLQNIPTRTELGRTVRNGFIAAPGQVLLSVDYSQVELRIVAHIAGDQAMLDAFRQDQDIHATTAAAIYGIPLDQVTKEQRRHAKAINFGLIYGMSAFGLTRTTDLTLSEADAFVKAYFQQFPGVKKYLDETRKLAAKQGYVETLLGRRRYFPALTGQLNQQLRNREEREAINAPIQGTAADIMKIAMIKIPAALASAGLQGCMLLQVHDEIVLECPQDELAATARVVQQVMEGAYELSIPLSTEARWGRCWGEMQVLK
jgi:DNA polymerase-1